MKVTKFQQSVYDFVRTIPTGQTRSYLEVAVAIGRPRAVRAVGNALNKNPLAPDVPCHRVIKSDGSLGGFASGAVRKSRLLRGEGVVY